jgi:hypothetical protein
MCNFKSGIWTRKGMLYSLDYDSHEKLIIDNNLDDTTLSPDFVRIEIIPINNMIEDYGDVGKWRLKIDQDCLPKWFTKSNRLECDSESEKMLRDVWDKRFITKNIDGISNGNYYVLSGGVVQTVQSGGVVRNVWSGGVVQAVQSGGVVQQIEGTGHYVKDGKIYVSSKAIVIKHINKK